jgi:hypothetical protein
VEFAASYEPATIEDRCRASVNNAIEAHFEKYPVESVEPERIQFSRDVLKLIARWAQLLAQARVELESIWIGDQTVLSAKEPEGPYRIIVLLRTLLQGLAFVQDKFQIGLEDPALEVVRHVVVSSIPRHRRQLLRAVLTNGGTINSSQAQNVLGLAAPSSVTTCPSLQQLGLYTFTLDRAIRVTG